MDETVVVFHNPACGTSRSVVALIRQAGIEPHIVEYLKTPPTRQELVDLIARMGVSPRAILRRKGTPYDDLNLDDMTMSDDALIDAMITHPILIQRPIVITAKGVKLCRPIESVLDVLPVSP
ncbi:MAG: arsenate reductase (glutaredoxin) [Rhodospirillaceae bacterium]|nr:arsenate reductase (glutaredoxin) [Rhodospirillaceae bacterium]